MQTIQEIAKVLGLSTRAVYRRLDAFNGKLDGYLTRGINNEILFNSSALALLQRLEDIRTAEGIPIRQAVARIGEEVEGNGVRPVREGDGNPIVEQLEYRLRDKDRLIEQLQGEVLFLRNQVTHLTPLALPRRRGWLPWRRTREV